MTDRTYSYTYKGQVFGTSTVADISDFSNFLNNCPRGNMKAPTPLAVLIGLSIAAHAICPGFDFAIGDVIPLSGGVTHCELKMGYRKANQS